MTRRTNTKSRLLSSAVALTFLSSTTLLQTAHASLSCASPSGSYQVGDTVRLELSGNSWWPRLKDVYSITANVYCSSGSGTVASMSISNGDSWTIPESALGKCSEDKLYVQFTGQMYDFAHLAHILPYWESCGTLSVAPAPPKPTTTTTKAPTVPPTQPPTQQPPTNTRDPTVPTGVPPITTNPPTLPPTTTTTTSYSPIYTTTYTLVPTVISGTSTVISVTTVIVVTPTALPPVLTSTGLPTDGAITPPDNSQLPGLPPSPGGNNNNSTNKNGSNTNVPAAALGAVGGVAALALIVFGLVVTRKRRRMREEQEQAASAGLGSKDDYYYDGASSFGPGTGGALAGAAAVGAGAGVRHSSDDRSMPSLHHAYPPVHPPVDTSASYGWDFNTSFAAAGTPGSSSAAAGGDSTLLPFPVPATTSDALKQQYDLANRLSVVSQDDSMLGFPLVPKSSPPPQAPASATTAYALNQQMSLKQELDNEDDAAFAVAGGESPELYYLPVSGESGSSPTTTPSQAFLSARGSPGATSASAGGATTMRSSTYETVHSNSSAYATADSPSWSAASLQSHDIAIPMPPSSGGGGSGSGVSGNGGQHNIQDLIRDVLRDD